MTMDQRLRCRELGVFLGQKHLIMVVCNRDRSASKLGIIIIHNRNLQRSGNIRTEFLATLANMDVSKTPRLTCNLSEGDHRASASIASDSRVSSMVRITP